jgi:hypothetical protein
VHGGGWPGANDLRVEAMQGAMQDGRRGSSEEAMQAASASSAGESDRPILETLEAKPYKRESNGDKLS